MKICKKCNISFDPGKWNKSFCSRKCANSRTFTPETEQRRSESVKRSRKKFTEDQIKSIKIKQLAGYRKTKPELFCKCGVKILSANKHKMCWDCYIESDVFMEIRGHAYKNYKRMHVRDSLGNTVLLMSSLEIMYFEYLTTNNIKWCKPASIKYLDNSGKKHRYRPDFYLIDTNEIIETKGYWWGNDKQKMEWVIEQNPHLIIKILTKNDILSIAR